MTGPRRLHTPAGRFATAWTVPGAVAAVWFWWMVTEATGDLLRRQPLNGDFYDAQARSLLDGNLAVPASVLNIEAYVHDGKTYMYFPPFPALLRMPVVAITDALDGRTSALFMVLAFVLAMTASGILAWRVRRLVRGDAPTTRTELTLTVLGALLIGMGSPLFFTGSRSWVYHEAALWAMAFSICAYDQIVAFLGRPTGARLVRASAFAGAAVLSRLSIGAGPLVALGLVGALLVLARLWARAGGLLRWFAVPDPLRSGRWIAGMAIAVVLPTALFAAVNSAKFGTPFGIPFDTQLQNLFDAQRRRVLAANDGSLLTPAAIPTQVLQLLRPDAIRVHGTFPWVGFPTTRPTVVGDLLFDQRDYTVSLTAAMPALLVLAVSGAIAALRRPALAPLRVAFLGAAAVVPVSLSILYVAQRYTGDLLPQLLLGVVAVLPVVAGALERRRAVVRRLVLAGVAVLTAAGAATGVALALEYQRNLTPLVPDRVRAQYVGWQSDVAARLGFGRPALGIGDALPPAGTRDSRFVIGRCAALYASDGDRWRGVERTNAAGHFRLAVTLRRRAAGTVEPLVAAGSGADRWLLAIRHRSDGRAEVVEEGRGLRGSPFPVDPGRTVEFDVLLDPHVDELQVSRAGIRVLRGRYDGPGDRYTIGADPDDPTTTFGGRIRNLPISTEVCDRVRDRARSDP